MTSLTTRGARLALLGAVGVWIGIQPVKAGAADLFQPVGNLIQGRAGSQATRLEDGSVLITGGAACGIDSCTPLAHTELFDPKTNQFIAVGPMIVPRDDSHRAVRLRDGRVLVTGGSDFQKQFRSAELFDPASRTFAATGDMTVGRAAHSASGLRDGRVLVVGGWPAGGTDPTERAELFDPATGKFQSTGAMKTGRYRHSAVALPDGRVVILGGYGPANQAVRSVELYDPVTGAFTPGGDLVEARGDASATLLSEGRILVVGGNRPDSTGQPSLRKTVELYDPATSHSVAIGMLTEARVTHTAVLLADGRVLVAGGFGESGELRTAELIDPIAGKIEPTVSMTIERSNVTGLLLADDRALIIGGDNPDGSGTLNTAEVYTTSGESPSTP